MSYYKETATTNRRSKTRKQPPGIIPHVSMRPSNPDAPPENMPGESARKFAQALRDNSGLAIRELGPLLNPDPPYKFERIEAVTEIVHKDNSVAFLEVRIKRQTSSGHVDVPNLLPFPQDTIKLDKEYKHIFVGDKIWPPDEQGQERTERSILCSTTSALINAGLFIPTNAPAALDLLRRYRKELGEYNKRLSAFKAAQSPTHERDPNSTPALFPERQPAVPIIICTEGEKTRRGVQSYIDQDDPAVMSLLEEYNVEIVTLGVLAGMTGSRGTNFFIRPNSQDFIVTGVNDELLETSLAQWIIVRDNDDAGIKESLTTANSLHESFGVPIDQIRIANPPSNVKSRWDDGDTLPPGMTPYDRLKQILDTKSMLEQYALRQVGSGKNAKWEVDPSNHNNKRLAIKRITSSMFDEQSTGNRFFIIPETFLDGSVPLAKSEVLFIATLCLKDMGHPPLDNLLRNTDWEPVLIGHFDPTLEKRNFIYEETMRDIDRGQLILANAPNPEIYNPETYLLDAFSLPDTPRNRSISKIIIRDYLAVTLRPFLDKKEIIPQVIFVLYGDEGIGKSEFCKVLAGGRPGPESHHLRYTNSVDISDLKSQFDRMQVAFAQKVIGRTIVEFPDKALGDAVSVAQSGMLNNLANMSRIEFRRAYGQHDAHVPRQFITFFTTNREDLLGHNMGQRRYLIVDTGQSMKGFAKLSVDLLNKQKDNISLTPEEEIMARGHNPGIQKNFEKRAATLAYMYNSEDWKGSLTVPPELTYQMQEERKRFGTVSNAELFLEEIFSTTPYGPGDGPLITESRAILSFNIIDILQWRYQCKITESDFGKIMKKLGYFKVTKWTKRGWSKTEDDTYKVRECAFHTNPKEYGIGQWVFTNDPRDLYEYKEKPPRKEVDPEVFQ
jgi:hypothetical protein